jgi:predicted nucleic acid-binding protein
MREAVLDASVVLKWFRTEGERQVEAARALRTEFEAGRLLVVVPALLGLELLNVAARCWSWQERKLVTLVATMRDLGFEQRDPDLEPVARWTTRGLTAYDAVYVALAEAEAIQLVTDDELILDVAGSLATPLHDCC